MMHMQLYCIMDLLHMYADEGATAAMPNDTHMSLMLPCMHLCFLMLARYMDCMHVPAVVL